VTPPLNYNRAALRHLGDKSHISVHKHRHTTQLHGIAVPVAGDFRRKTQILLTAVYRQDLKVLTPFRWHVYRPIAFVGHNVACTRKDPIVLNLKVDFNVVPAG